MGKEQNLNSTQNLVHPEWEILDPTPDIYSLFPLFDHKFFQGRLACVQLEWSKKMYNCAGICYQRSNRTGKSCIIRLSEPLLKLRPRKDLIQTLLHEMIHAYCFVLGIREGNGGHGPTFKKIMNGINKIAGTNITVYHSFHDEVNLYKTHWWKCNGPCQNRHPYYGVVKRTTNRKPGTYDFWWQEHQLTCGGEFIKVKEPSPKRKRAIKNKENILGSQTSSQPRSQDTKPKSTPRSKQKNVISNYFNNSTSMDSTGSVTPSSSTRSVPPKKPTYTPGAKPNFGGGTLVIRKPPSVKTSTVTPKSEKPSESGSRVPVQSPSAGGNLRNVKQFKDLSSDDEGQPKKPSQPPVQVFSGKGFVLGSSDGSGERRSRLLDKFPAPTPKPSSSKKARTESKPNVPSSSKVETAFLSDDSDNMFEDIDLEEVERTAANIKKERQDAIRREIADSFADEEEGDILLIDDDYDDELADVELTNIDDSLLDRSILDDLFNNGDELMDDFNRTNAKVKIEKPDDEIVSCPLCFKKMTRPKIGDHLELCYSNFSVADNNIKQESTLSRDQSPKSSTTTTANENQPSTSGAQPAARQSAGSDLLTAQQQLLRECGYGEEDIARVLEDVNAQELPAPNMEELRQQVLRDCGYTDADIARVLDLASEEDALDNDVEFISAVESCECPICGQKIALSSINNHLDQCLTK